MELKTMVKELLASGMTQKEIASEIGCVQSQISGLVTGKRSGLGWKSGNALHELYKSRIGLAVTASETKTVEEAANG